MRHPGEENDLAQLKMGGLFGHVWQRKQWLWSLLLLVAFGMTACGGGEERPEPTVVVTAAATEVLTEAPTEAAEEAPTEVVERETPEAANNAVTPETPSALESPLQAESPLAGDSPLATPQVLPTVEITVEASSVEFGVFGGVVLSSQPGNPPLVDTVVRLGDVFWQEDGSGNFVIEGARSPGTYTRPDGSFVITDLPPGDYMMVVGDLVGKHEILKTPEGRAQVFTVEGGKLTNIGTILVNLP